MVPLMTWTLVGRTASDGVVTFKVILIVTIDVGDLRVVIRLEA